MTVPKGFTLGGVQLNATVIEQITEFSVDPAIELFINRNGSAYDPTFVAGRSTTPRANFSSNAVAALLDAVGVTGLAIGDATSAKLFFAQLEHRAGIKAGATHFSVAINDGLIIPNSISASHNQEATMAISIAAAYDGTNLPLVLDPIATLPAYASTLQKYTVGGIKLGGTIYDVDSINVQFGISLHEFGRNGIPYTEFMGLKARDTKVTFSTKDLSLINTLTSIGSSQVDAVVFFKKITDLGWRTAPATAEHISISISDCFASPGVMSASQNNLASSSVTLTPKYDGTNAVMVVDTTAAIA